MRRRDRLTAVSGAIIALIIALGVLVGMTDARAQQYKCGPQPMMHDQLKTRYKEDPEHIGAMINGNILEVWSSLSGTFTILVTNPQKLSCIIADGDGWTRFAPVVLGPDA